MGRGSSRSRGVCPARVLARSGRVDEGHPCGLPFSNSRTVGRRARRCRRDARRDMVRCRIVAVRRIGRRRVGAHSDGAATGRIAPGSSVSLAASDGRSAVECCGRGPLPGSGAGAENHCWQRTNRKKAGRSISPSRRRKSPSEGVRPAVCKHDRRGRRTVHMNVPRRRRHHPGFPHPRNKGVPRCNGKRARGPVGPVHGLFFGVRRVGVRSPCAAGRPVQLRSTTSEGEQP